MTVLPLLPDGMSSHIGNYQGREVGILGTPGIGNQGAMEVTAWTAMEALAVQGAMGVMVV